jgi:23S rRNA pseudouridine1911/1915/1917 synthase
VLEFERLSPPPQPKGKRNLTNALCLHVERPPPPALENLPLSIYLPAFCWHFYNIHMRKLEYIVEDAFDGAEVATVLRSVLQMGRKTIRHAKFLPDGITLDGVQAYTIHKVRAGQTIKVVIGDTSEEVKAQTMVPVEGMLDILYEDEDLLLINKPAGMPTHPGPKHPLDSLGNILIYYFEQTNQNCLLHPIHRLDWGTSGVIVFAKNGYTQDVLQKRFHTNEFTRTYLAICHGVPEAREGTVTHPIGLVEKRWIACSVEQGGKFACSHYKVLDESPDKQASLIELQLETGRTHQIRIHMALIGHPLVGDTLYGGFDTMDGKLLIDRTALHSYHVSFEHPITKTTFSKFAPLPKDMLFAMQRLHIPTTKISQ